MASPELNVLCFPAISTSIPLQTNLFCLLLGLWIITHATSAVCTNASITVSRISFLSSTRTPSSVLIRITQSLSTLPIDYFYRFDAKPLIFWLTALVNYIRCCYTSFFLPLYKFATTFSKYPRSTSLLAASVSKNLKRCWRCWVGPLSSKNAL